MKDYKVGQVLYMIGEKSTKVLPIQVVEEIVRTTMDGKAKSYIIKLPDKAQTTADISEIKGDLFESTKTLREYMTKNATEAINKMITNAAKLRDSVFQYTIQENDSLTTESVKTHIDQLSMFPSVNPPTESAESNIQDFQEDTIKVDLGDGNYATMKTDSLKKLS